MSVELLAVLQQPYFIREEADETTDTHVGEGRQVGDYPRTRWIEDETNHENT